YVFAASARDGSPVGRGSPGPLGHVGQLLIVLRLDQPQPHKALFERPSHLTSPTFHQSTTVPAPEDVRLGRRREHYGDTRHRSHGIPSGNVALSVFVSRDRRS